MCRALTSAADRLQGLLVLRGRRWMLPDSRGVPGQLPAAIATVITSHHIDRLL